MALKVMQRCMARFKNLCVARAWSELKAGFTVYLNRPTVRHVPTQIFEGDIQDSDREKIKKRLHGMVDLLEQAKTNMNKDSKESLEDEIYRLNKEQEASRDHVVELESKVRQYETEVQYLEQEL